MINKPMMKDIIYSKSYSASVVQCTKNLNGLESILVLTSIMLNPVLICYNFNYQLLTYDYGF